MSEENESEGDINLDRENAAQREEEETQKSKDPPPSQNEKRVEVEDKDKETAVQGEDKEKKETIEESKGKERKTPPPNNENIYNTVGGGEQEEATYTPTEKQRMDWNKHRMGQSGKFETMGREKQWVNNFQLMCSKDNIHFHKSLREFFDEPRGYDVTGPRRKSPDPYKNEISRYTFIGAKTQMLKTTGSRLALGGTMSRTNQGGMSSLSRTTSKNLFKKQFSHHFDAPNMFSPIPDLRKRNRSPVEKKREVRWDNRVDRISTFNRVVHPSFRILFESIAGDGNQTYIDNIIKFKLLQFITYIYHTSLLMNK